MKTPALALFAARDTLVDPVNDPPRLRRYFTQAGMREVTIVVYPNADHNLDVSVDGFRPSDPLRVVSGYPKIMIDWLAERGLAWGNSLP